MPSSAVGALVLLCLASPSVAVRQQRAATAMTFGRRSGGEWWPFSLALGSSAGAPPAPAPPVPKLQEAKDRVMLSAPFGRKIAQICQDASDTEMRKCRQLAGERLFCALLQRHAEKFQGMAGTAEAKANCKETDIMETALEAAQDAKLQEDAAKS
uniref:Uncharacterized protein n=1 Tax=Alexandrium andersonii TaxID=327968 RepID=A0A6U6JS70_9DINO|mmetsp:Transcript_1511/g.3358  ORF Transcript_1511/g.3358 Transcript_1511/m.3358 type:complete len:155 (+) Transcript_1511:94-558(+)